MALIYVLQKDVPGLGLLSKVGMTMRSGDDRASEYGGGGWECLKEYPVQIEDVSELKQIERRVHECLDEFKCHEAVGFGLTEVFTCSPDIAMSIVKDVVGSEPSMDDDAKRLKVQMTKGVVSKFRKQYESAYAKLIREGEYEGKNPYSDDYRKYWSLDRKNLGLLKLCDEYVELLDHSGGDDPIFRTLLEQERSDALERLDKASTKYDAELKKQEELRASAGFILSVNQEQKRKARLQTKKAELKALKEAHRRDRNITLRNSLILFTIALFLYVVFLT